MNTPLRTRRFRSVCATAPAGAAGTTVGVAPAAATPHIPPRGMSPMRARVRRGALLLEVMLSLTLFVGAGGAVLGIVSQGVGSLKAAREKLHAADLARSAMAEIEAGIATVETLNGPVPLWTDPDDEAAGGGGGGDTTSADSGWELRVETSPTSFPGLTLVRITASRSNSQDQSSSYTLSQLVRLIESKEDTIGEEDDISKAAERGENRLERRGTSRPERNRGGTP